VKAFRLTGLRRMECLEVPDPGAPGRGQALLRVLVVGVCGSDMHYYTTGRIGSQVILYPFTIGHECSAEVVAVGPGVAGLKLGDCVAVEPAMSCGRCDQCAAGRHHTCRELRFLGCPGQAEGCLCELLLMPAECCLPVPAACSPERAALVEPLAIGLYAARLAGLRPASPRVGVLGCGPIGLSVLLGLAAESAGATVYATDLLAPRLAAARTAGAAWTGNPAHEDVEAAVARREPGGLDIVFECCGRPEALDQAVRLLKPGGKLLLVGIPAEDRVSFSIDLLRRKELCLQNVRRQNACAQDTIARVADGRIVADYLVTHRFPFSRTPEAFDLVAGYHDGVIKAMIEMQG